jgi:integrase
VWSLDYSDAQGRRSRVQLSSDRRVAERMRTQLIHERDMALAGLGTVQGQELPLGEIRDLYLADLKPQVVPRHHEGVGARLERMLSVFGDIRVRDLKPLTLMQYRNARLAEGKAQRTANVDVATLKACLNWAVSAGLIAANPIGAMKMLVEKEAQRRYRRRALSEEEIDRFLAAARADDEANERFLRKRRGNVYYMRKEQLRVPQAPLWRGLLETGARWSELTRATWADVDLDSRILSLRPEHTKSGRPRFVPIMQSLAADLRKIRALQVRVFGREVIVFLSPEGKPWSRSTNNAMRVFDRVLEAAKIPRVDERGLKLDIHALRHTFATRCARSGVGLVQAQHLLGHSDPKLTAKIYSHLEPDDLRTAMDEMERRMQKGRAKAQ